MNLKFRFWSMFLVFALVNGEAKSCMEFQNCSTCFKSPEVECYGFFNKGKLSCFSPYDSLNDRISEQTIPVYDFDDCERLFRSKAEQFFSSSVSPILHVNPTQKTETTANPILNSFPATEIYPVPSTTTKTEQKVSDVTFLEPTLPSSQPVFKLTVEKELSTKFHVQMNQNETTLSESVQVQIIQDKIEIPANTTTRSLDLSPVNFSSSPILTTQSIEPEMPKSVRKIKGINENVHLNGDSQETQFRAATQQETESSTVFSKSKLFMYEKETTLPMTTMAMHITKYPTLPPKSITNIFRQRELTPTPSVTQNVSTQEIETTRKPQRKPFQSSTTNEMLYTKIPIRTTQSNEILVDANHSISHAPAASSPTLVIYDENTTQLPTPTSSPNSTAETRVNTADDRNYQLFTWTEVVTYLCIIAAGILISLLVAFALYRQKVKQDQENSIEPPSELIFFRSNLILKNTVSMETFPSAQNRVIIHEKYHSL